MLLTVLETYVVMQVLLLYRGLERKRLRLSLVDARSTPTINADFKMQSSETSSNEELLASSEHLFCAHDTIDLSSETKQHDKDYVRISKQEYEEIKSRVSAIENRLSREFTDVTPRVEPVHHVQTAYEQTLEEVAMLHCSTSDHLARRLSKELKIRPNEQGKIIRSPSARKIGSIRRRSKENVTKIERHKSWNVPFQSSHNADRFYPYIGLTRERTSTVNSDNPKDKAAKGDNFDRSISESSANVSDSSRKYQLRKRASLTSDYVLNKTIGKPHARRSLNATANSWDGTASENSALNNTLNSSDKSHNSGNDYQNITKRLSKRSPAQHKWRSAAAFFINKTGESDNSSHSGRPSVNKLRRQNAGAVLAKAKMFESSSDRSSERAEIMVHTGFARKPRVSHGHSVKIYKPSEDEGLPYVPPKMSRNVPPAIPSRSDRTNGPQSKDVGWLNSRRATPSVKVVSPQAPAMKKTLCTPRTLRVPASAEGRRATPMKAIHVSPRRRSPRQKVQRYYYH